MYQAVVVSKIEKEIEDGISSLSLQNLVREKLGDNDVRIKVHCAALNYFDLLLLVGRYQHKPKLPFVIVQLMRL